MIPSQASHDYTLVDQLNIIPTTQTVDAHTNESNIESKTYNIKTKVSHLIGNIPRKSYKGATAAVIYTCETIMAHPKIVSAISIVTMAAYSSLQTYNYKLCKPTGEAGNPIVATFILVVDLIIALVSVAVISVNYKSLKNQKATLPSIAGSIVLIVAAASLLIVTLADPIAYAAVPSYRAKWCLNLLY